MTKIQELIEAQPDVRRVHRLAPSGDGRFRYLIETRHATFPRYAVGSTDAGLNDVRISLRCGAEWSALDHWAVLEKEDRKP